jgi:hypothetical protein
VLKVATAWPMKTFDSSRPALVHDGIIGEWRVWDGSKAEDWHRFAGHPPVGFVTWNGPICDAWTTEEVAGASQLLSAGS